MKQQTVYYAHCMALYNTAQETRDVEFLQKLGYHVLNPNVPEHSAGCASAKGPGELFRYGGQQFSVDPRMLYFQALVEGCDVLAFRALPDGSIPAGVYLEIAWARNVDIPVIELPSSILRRGLTREQTREYIAEVGAW